MWGKMAQIAFPSIRAEARGKMMRIEKRKDI